MLLYARDCNSFKDFVELILRKLLESANGDNLAHIIVVDQNLFDSHCLGGIDEIAPVSYINRVENVRVTLVESLSELFKVLGDHFLVRGNSEFSDSLVNRNTTIIGVYGFFDLFLRKGTELMKMHPNADVDDNESREVTGDAFMTTAQYSAKTINYICNLMYNLRFYRKYGIYLADCEDIANNEASDNTLAIWDRQIPNLQPDDLAVGYDHDAQETKDRKEDILVGGTYKEAASGSNTSDLRNLIEKYYNDADNSVKTQLDFVPLGLILSKWMKFI